MCLFRILDNRYRLMKNHGDGIVHIFHVISFSLLMGITLFFFIYEVWFILPILCDTRSWSYTFNCMLCIYTLHNIIGNFLMCWLTDNSMKSLPNYRQHPPPTEARFWHLCTQCQMMVPPRSWHCQSCRRCTLKRDHHCTFTANCIGHNNHRYFICMLFHLSVGCGICLVFNTIESYYAKSLFFADSLILFSIWGLIRQEIVDEHFWHIVSSCIIKLNFFLTVLAIAQLVYQLIMLSRNSTCHRFKDCIYDQGFKKNVELIMGRRKFWVLLSPFMDSPLPHDGTQWQLAKHYL
ncbi:uncharacterized protein Dwil_GK18990 [Drosophila willistoni]|uniref:Palmitoyltransferase n=1 Tax=Drosophila willistoni TaxID=7260 RepID=B4NJC4_DROWI|nr:probable palmitoyltransferase ZDHHC24 [Drosophila willistoni]EDW84955.2 uncharacterized protein Dwil_GK18990 [Drosophila willistoni]